jgi:hypothetical protein
MDDPNRGFLNIYLFFSKILTLCLVTGLEKLMGGLWNCIFVINLIKKNLKVSKVQGRGFQFFSKNWKLLGCHKKQWVILDL